MARAAMRGESSPPHWLGVLLLSQDKQKKAHPLGKKTVETLSVIDGQQRLTTCLLWLAALAHHGADSGQGAPAGVSKLSRLSVQEVDRVAFEVAIKGKWRQKQYASLLASPPLRAYSYFRWLLWLGADALAEDEAVTFKQLKGETASTTFEDQWNKVLATKVGGSIPRGDAIVVDELVDATLHSASMYAIYHVADEDESAATIFDTLNGMRTPLEPLDHVRNSLFVRLSEDKAKALYESAWKATEERVRQVKIGRMNPEKAFLYDFLIARGEKARQGSLGANRGAAHFGSMTRGMAGDELETLIEDEVLPAMAAWPAVVRKSDEYHLRGVNLKLPAASLRLMTSIQDLSNNPANPAVLHFVKAFVVNEISEADLLKSLEYIEAFLARQLLAGRPLSPLRSKVMDVMAKVDRDTDPEKLRDVLRATDWQSDIAIRASLKEREMYGRLKSSAILALFRGIERQKSGDGAMFFTGGSGKGSYTVEHIFPQKSSKWMGDLGAWGVALQDMQDRLHHFGNLAPVTSEHNSTVGNEPFNVKRTHPTKPGKAAPLSVNASWIKMKMWTPKAVDARGKTLTDSALKLWTL